MDFLCKVAGRKGDTSFNRTSLWALVLLLWPWILFSETLDHGGVPSVGNQSILRELEASDFQTDPSARFKLAAIYCNQENWDGLRDLIKALKKEVYFQDISHYFNGRLLLSENRIGSARRAFEAALKKRPEAMTGLLPHIYFYKAYCLKKLNQIERSRASFQKALDNGFKAENASELIKLAEFLNYFRQPNETIALIHQYPESVLKENHALSAVLGRAYQMQNLHYMAIQSFTQSLDTHAEQFLTLTLRANSYRQVDDLESALADIQKADELLPGQADQQFIHGLIFFQMGRLEAAFSQLKKAEHAYKTDESFLVLYASLSEAIGKDATALSTIEDYFKLDFSPPNKTAILINLTLNPSLNKDLHFDPYYSDVRFFRLYMQDRLSLKEVLSTSSDASITYFLAQAEKRKNKEPQYRELLVETLRRSSEKSPEHLFALWQLNQIEK